jgi:NAD(P)-dependent dehydrogenase (short-subunit alcohol dehydrogenase family)
MQGQRNIVVTGSNKGIGYGIVENLAAKGGWNIIMACRDAGRGKKSQEELLAKYPNASIQVEQLDVSNKESVEQFIKVIEDKYKNIDVLLNNAGVAAKGDSFDSDVANFTFTTVFYVLLLRIFTERLIFQRLF